MGLGEVIFQQNRELNVNELRTIITFICDENDSLGLTPKQVRVVSISRGDSRIGDHWREYAEIYSVIGQANFKLEDIDTKEQSQYDLKTGDRLFVPPRIALSICSQPSSVIVLASQETDRERYTHKYQVV